MCHNPYFYQDKIPYFTLHLRFFVLEKKRLENILQNERAKRKEMEAKLNLGKLIACVYHSGNHFK